MRKSIGKIQPIRTIIFDYGKTLVDPGPELVPGAKEILEYLLKEGYWLKLASIVGNGTANDRFTEMRELGIDHYFQECKMRPDPTKFTMLYDLVSDGGKNKDVNYEQVAVIDDRTADGRALHWGYLHGAKTIWLRRGKFADELPPMNRLPDFTISSLHELKEIFKQIVRR